MTDIHCEKICLGDASTTPASSVNNDKRVSFATSIVKDSFEPFVPKSDVCTSEELINHYKQACLRYSTVPSDFLLEQLRGVDLSICNERYSRLSLRGVKMTPGHMEALEEVFKRVHFREVDFEDSYLEEHCTGVLFDMLIHYESCTDLILTANFDKPHPRSAWVRALQYLRRSSELRSFTLVKSPLLAEHFVGMSFIGLRLDFICFRDCQMTGDSLKMFCRWLKAFLSYGGIDFCSRNPNAHPGGTSLTAARQASRGRATQNWRTSRLIQRYAPDLGIWRLRFHLPENRLTSSDVESLLPLLRHCILRPLDTFQDEQAPVIGGNGYLYELNLSQNNIRDEGLRNLCSGILVSYQTARNRVQAEANSITEKSTDEQQQQPPAEELPRLGPRQLLDRARVESVRLLEKLNLASNGLTSQSMQPLASVLRLCPTADSRALLGGLTHLDLSNNMGIGDSGLELLCEGLVRNQSLVCLHLRSVRMSFAGLFALCGFLSETYTLEQLDIRGNTIRLDGLMALARTLTVNQSLTSLLMDRRSALVSTDSHGPVNTSTANDELEQHFMKEIETALLRNRCLPNNLSDLARKRNVEQDLDEDIEQAEALLEASADVSTIGDEDEATEKDWEELLSQMPEPNARQPPYQEFDDDDAAAAMVDDLDAEEALPEVERDDPLPEKPGDPVPEA